MVTQRTRATLIRLVVGVALLTTLAFVAAGTARATTAGTPYAYADKAGDSGSAPDLQQVVLTDNGDGTVGVEIDLAAVVPDDGDSMVLLGIDADRNRQTGDNLGLDYGVGVDAQGVWMMKYDDGDWVAFNHAPSSPTILGGRINFTLTLSDFGVTSFNFVALSFHGDDSDAAPEYGEFSYPDQSAKPAIAGIILSAVALFPKAGSTYTFAAPQVRLTTGDIVAADSVTCALSYKGVAIKPLRQCTWKIPKTYKAKHLLLKVTAVYGGSTKTISLTVTPA
jgi:hypothetical protein